VPLSRSLINRKSPTDVDAATAGGLPLYLFFEQKDPFVYVSNDEVFAAWCGERPLPAECRGILKAVTAASQLLVFLRLMEEKFGHEITRIVRVHLLITADRAPDFQFSALLRAMADVIQREAQLEEWLGSKPIARRIARAALLTIPVSPYFIPAEKGSPDQVNPPLPQEDVIDALNDLLCNAIRDAQRIFEPAVRALVLRPESIKGLRGRDNSADGTPATESQIQWSRNPGRFQRYLQIRHDNPLFPPERRTVERRALMTARSRDAEEREGFQAEMMSHVNELISIFQVTQPAAYARVDDYRVKLEALIQKAAELGPSVEQDRATLWKLWNSLVEDIEKGITQWEVDETLESGHEWIVPVGHAEWCLSPYDKPSAPDDHLKSKPKTMAGSLLKKLLEKADECHASKLKTACCEVHLLIAYDRAMAYCSPIVPFKRIQEIAKDAVARATGGSWPFIRTFLLIANEDDPRAHRLL
jgi:hypothetical protein